MTSTPVRSLGNSARGYTNEQRSLRAKLDQILKWTKDLKSSVMKQSCKVLQPNQENRRATIDQIHDDLDDYKRKLDRELGLIHDICDALTVDESFVNGDEENLNDEILEALRRSPTYSSLEQHMFDDKRPKIRLKPRERIHPGQNQIPRVPFISMNSIKRKASQPITLQVIDTTAMPGSKRRPPLDAFKRSRSFTNVEHIETQLGIDYIEENDDDVSWKPFGPKKSLSQSNVSSMLDEQSNSEPLITDSSINFTPAPEKEPTRPVAIVDDNESSDEEFDVAWQRRAAKQARKAIVMGSNIETPSKRAVRFSQSIEKPTEFEKNEISRESNVKLSSTDEIIDLECEDETQSTLIEIIPATSSKDVSASQLIQESDLDDSDDEIIALSDEENPSQADSSMKKVIWTTSEIQIIQGNSQSLNNPYRIGIADPTIHSIFLGSPNSQTSSVNRKSTNQKVSINKRTPNGK